MNLNKVLILGNVTRDPELRALPNGGSVASFGIATNRTWKDKAGQRQQEAEYHSVVLWGRLAQIASQYLQKGNMVYIEGRIRTRSWDAPDGTKKYRTEVIAERMQLGPKPMGGTGGGEIQKEQEVKDEPKTEEIPIIEEEGEIDVKDIPF